jgi:membrane fusion protein, multidrug efflux system
VKTKFDLDNTLITIPISGRIERSRLYEGRLISAQTDGKYILVFVYAMSVGLELIRAFSDRRDRLVSDL